MQCNANMWPVLKIIMCLTIFYITMQHMLQYWQNTLVSYSIYGCYAMQHNERPNIKNSLCMVIDQAWGQDGWILTEFSFCLFMDWDGVKGHKLAKKERGQYPATLTEKAWSIKDLWFGLKGNFSGETWQVIPSRQDSSILGSSCLLTELVA